MSDVKGNVKKAIDQTADKAKEVTEKVVDKGKAAVHKTGEKIEEAGSAIKKKA